MIPFALLALFGAAAMAGRRPPARATTNNGPGVSYIPAPSALRARAPAAKAPAVAKAAAQAQTARNAQPKPTPVKLSMTPAPGSATPATPAERAAVEQAVKQAIAQHQAAESAAPSSSSRSPKQAAQELAAFLKRTGRFGSDRDRAPEILAAQRDLGVAADGIVGPVTRTAAAKQGVRLPPRPAAKIAAKPKPTSATRAPTKRAAAATTRTPRPSSGRTPREAATALRVFLQKTHRFGSKADRPAEIALAQQDLGVTADGIVGPATRAAAQRAGVTLPTR
jgi:murein L,D-transpeptidase YcbB/YkuD